MNKQEAINELKKYKVGFGEAAAVRFDRIVSVINQIHEPQKVVVPKFIGDLIEKLKIAGYTIGEIGAYVYDYEELFYRAFLDCYEIEQEKLYTVEIPDPNSYCDYRYLSRNDNGICLDASNDTKWKQKKRNQFTESEIKEDFEWAWQFAKEVE
ncbi:TPA: DUF1642 domain-containing protein [Streptococcus suis]|nr:DUF1642 domain-containing protein [Streptococcus suis]HEM4631166.1 DUF1642 domain-containing protein [Streptococcus suis]